MADNLHQHVHQRVEHDSEKAISIAIKRHIRSYNERDAAVVIDMKKRHLCAI